MQWKQPKNTDKYHWTAHVTEKMHFYGLSEQKVLGVIRKPQRIESSIVENTVAVMLPVGNIRKGSATKPASAKASAWRRWGGNGDENNNEDTWNQEIWVMYQTKSQNIKHKTQNKEKALVSNFKNIDKEKAKKLMKLMPKKLTIISAWRYPGVSPKNNPIPEDILREISEII